jgi:hypothetical protein
VVVGESRTLDAKLEMGEATQVVEVTSMYAAHVRQLAGESPVPT